MESETDRMAEDRAADLQAKASLWNSLEIAKILTSALTSLTVATVGGILAYQSSVQSNHHEDVAREQTIEEARLQKVIDKRMAVWDSVSGSIEVGNDYQRMACFSKDAVRYLDGKTIPNSQYYTVPREAIELSKLQLRKISPILRRNIAYFSENFAKSLQAYWIDHISLVMSFEHGANSNGFHSACVKIQTDHDAFIKAARSDLALDAGSLGTMASAVAH